MYKRLRNYFSNSDLLRNAATLIVGTLLAQLIPILFQPLLRRMFSAEEFGTAALYITAVGMLVAVANLKYESAIVLPKQDKEAHELISGGVLISGISALVIWLLIFLNEGVILRQFDLDNSSARYLHLLPLSIFLVSSFQCFNYYLIRKKAFKDSAKNKVYRRTAEAITQTTGAYMNWSSGLLIGNLVGDILNFWMGLKQALNAGFSFCFELKNISSTLKHYWQFPVYQALPSLLNTISLTLPIFIVNAAFGMAETGQFDLTRLVLSLPMALVSIALSQVYLQHQAEKISNKQHIANDFKKVSLSLLAMSIPFALILFFLATPIYSFLFGKEWNLAGELTAILIFGQTLKFIVSPLSSTLIALQDVRFSAIWQTVYFAFMLWLYNHPGATIYEFALRYVFIDLGAYSLYLGLIYWRIKQYEKQRA